MDRDRLARSGPGAPGARTDRFFSDVPGLRGDYGAMDADWVIAQDWGRYGQAEHARWARLLDRQMRLLPGHAAPVFSAAVARLGLGATIPDFDAVSRLLGDVSGWRLVAVPGLVPNEVFFGHLARRRFPVSRWIREEAEIDYLVEPDVFHDFFGHVPLLLDRTFADFLEAYGARGADCAGRPGLADALSRLYWYMVEFGLIETADGLRAIGAGLLSSTAELRHCLADPTPPRIAFAPGRVMRTLYRIDAFQETYFVLRDLGQLCQAIDLDVTAILDAIADMAPIPAGVTVAGDRLYGALPPS